MNYRHLKMWTIVTLTVAILSIIMRSLWQIAVIPTAGTMVIFVPLVVALIGGNILLVYIVLNPQRLKKLVSLTVITAAMTGGMVAGIIHYVNFIMSPEAEPLLSKIISACFLSSGLSAYFLILWFLWSMRKTGESYG